MSERALSPPLPDAIHGLAQEIHVPGLPYPIGKNPVAAPWRDLLQAQWSAQHDQNVCDLLKGLDQPWSTRQVNAAYLADRIMDVYLRSSGLHPVLVAQLARLRYPLAWQLATDQPEAFLAPLVPWLDSLEDWRGWSDSGGRSSQALLDRLTELVGIINTFFETGSLSAFSQFCQQWYTDAERRRERSGRLHQRLLETETGAARQRRGDQLARATIGRALTGRHLPEPILDFVIRHWQPLLRQIGWQGGRESEDWRHASRLLEWLVWVGDPELSSQDLERLYQVGEQLTDRLADVWTRVWPSPLPPDALAGIERVLVATLRGEAPEVISTQEALARLTFDLRWLEPEVEDDDEPGRCQGQWYVTGEGEDEQRRFFLACLPETSEVLWTNGFGVRLGITPWFDFQQGLASGAIRRLPELIHFSDVLDETVSALNRVLLSQRQKRQEAARQAQARAEQLRLQKAAAERKRQQEEAQRRAAAEREQELAQEQARQAAAERHAAERARALEMAQAEVDQLGPGSWIALQNAKRPAEEQRLKLAVRLNARRKLIFVDRLGLNRTELLTDELAEHLLAGTARVLGAAAEFDETLSRVVGRIRVGK